ncbi:MAG: glycosyltransferase family 39 protein [Planctomycetes bacterium]|nr:glycosyltransferase family 39 protein [Planctomycetota bacterium]
MEATLGAEATSADKWQEWASRHQALLLGLCVAVALLLRLHALFAESFVNRDAVYYLDLAEKWSRADFATLMAGDPRLHVLPMYCFFVKLAIQAGLAPLTAALAVNLALGTALVPVMYGCGRALFASRGMGLLTALLTAVHPIFVDVSVQVFREDPMLLGLGAALWLAVKGEKKLHWWLGSGVGVAFAILSRYEALEAVGAAGVYLGLNWALGVAKVRGQIAKYGCFLLGVAMGIALFSLMMGIPWRFYDVNFINRVKDYL